MMHKKARKQFTEDKQTKDMDYWNYVLWSDETKFKLIWFRWCQACVAQPGEDTKTNLSFLQSSMGVRVSWSGVA